jgi:hypothetical protein
MFSSYLANTFVILDALPLFLSSEYSISLVTPILLIHGVKTVDVKKNSE